MGHLSPQQLTAQPHKDTHHQRQCSCALRRAESVRSLFPKAVRETAKQTVHSTTAGPQVEKLIDFERRLLKCQNDNRPNVGLIYNELAMQLVYATVALRAMHFNHSELIISEMDKFYAQISFYQWKGGI